MTAERQLLLDILAGGAALLILRFLDRYIHHLRALREGAAATRNRGFTSH